MKRTVTALAASQFVQNSSPTPYDDQNPLNSLTEGWDDLTAMKNEIAGAVLTFVMQVESVSKQKVVIDNLGVHLQEFQKLQNVFYTDLDGFTKKMEQLRPMHEHRTGPITSMEDLNVYNELAMEYTLLNSQLMTLIAPTITSIILLVDQATAPLIQQQGSNNV